MSILVSDDDLRKAGEAALDLARASRRLAACDWVRGEDLRRAVAGEISWQTINANQAEIADVLMDYSQCVAVYLVASGTALGMKFEGL